MNVAVDEYLKFELVVDLVRVIGLHVHTMMSLLAAMVSSGRMSGPGLKIPMVNCVNLP